MGAGEISARGGMRVLRMNNVSRTGPSPRLAAGRRGLGMLSIGGTSDDREGRDNAEIVATGTCSFLPRC